MRYGPLVVVLAISGTVVSGCQTTVPDIDTSSGSAASTGGTGTNFGTTPGTPGTTTDPTGSPTGTSTGQVVADGSTSFVFNDNGASTTGSAGTQVTVTDPGGGINGEAASVAVATANVDMTWADPITMPLFSNAQRIPAGVPALTGTYSEYREIDSDTDAELQIWETTHSRVGQYAVWFDPTAPNNTNIALFYDGDETPTTALPAATATYTGQFGGVAVVSNWIERDRVVDDPFAVAPSALAGEPWSPNGTWRVTGDSRVVADFGASTVTGTLSNSTWRKFVGANGASDGYITITPAETSRPFHDYTTTGTIVDSNYSGKVEGPVGQVVTGDTALSGGFFGPNAEETAGVFRSFTTSPSPSDGISPNEANRRGFIDIRGVFQGTQ